MEGLADALTSILSLSSSERIDLGAHTRERVEKYFEIGQITQQYEDIYTHL
jgi:glycosyltransferase involved in cell wall biosynthesis